MSSGSTLLDLVLSGGWAAGRVVNLVGDKAVGKTLIATEACANFMPLVRSVDDIRYIEAESAFDEAYGEQVGMPEGVRPIGGINTVEEMFADLDAFCAKRKGATTPSLYVVDSLDALSDTAELTRDMDKGSYHTEKARKLSELFRRKVRDISDALVLFMVVSQIRDKIGVTFGETKQRSGGHALDFYASQIVWLSEIRKIDRTIGGMRRVVGTHVRCRNKKNKVGPAYRETDVVLLFSYGIDDETSMLEYLDKFKVAPERELQDIHKQLWEARRTNDRDWVGEINAYLRESVHNHWGNIERQLLPPMRKYA